MDKYDKLLESLSSNQEIPGQLGNNIGGNTNLDLTGQEELLTSGLVNDSWDESSSSGFEDLPITDDDIQLECIFESSLFEHRGKPDIKNNKKSKKPGFWKRTKNNIAANSFGSKSAAKQNQKYNRDKAKQHQQKMKNSKGLKKAYHAIAKGYRNSKADNYKVIGDYGRAGVRMLNANI